MGHYKSNLRDIEFNLFEVFGAGDRLGKGPFAEMDEDTARYLLQESESWLPVRSRIPSRRSTATRPFTTQRRAPSRCRRSSRSPSRRCGMLTTGTHLCPTTWVDQARPQPQLGNGRNVPRRQPGRLHDAGWPRIRRDPDHLGTDEQKHWAEIMLERAWGATMVLTEPDAGSDVGAGRTKAIQQPDGSWHIEGVKRFITGGENDINENIIHLTLARPEGAGPGTKGLSLFVVPKYLFDTKTGELGERNGVYTTNIEKKMGIKASTTCELTFGEKQPAVGYLVGDVHDGIAQMFKVIEYARMLVGTKAIATLSTGYLNALDYAKNRVRVRTYADARQDRTARDHHASPGCPTQPDDSEGIRRGLRALVAYTAMHQDKVAMHNSEHGDGDMDDRMNDLLLPIVKVLVLSAPGCCFWHRVASDLRWFRFLQDYPLEQYVRDAKIDTLYEGTTAIQGMDFFFRKMVRDQFQAVTQLASEITETIKNTSGATSSLPSVNC